MGQAFEPASSAGFPARNPATDEHLSYSVEATGKSPQLAGWKACPTFFHSSPGPLAVNASNVYSKLAGSINRRTAATRSTGKPAIRPCSRINVSSGA